MWPNSVVNVPWRVSVSTRVPEMNVTPSTMARAVRARRSLCASNPVTVTFHTSAAQPLHLFEHRIGRRLDELAHYPTVGQEDHPVGEGRPTGVVGDHDDRLVEFGHRSPEEPEHLRRGVGDEDT